MEPAENGDRSGEQGAGQMDEQEVIERETRARWESLRPRLQRGGLRQAGNLCQNSTESSRGRLNPPVSTTKRRGLPGNLTILRSYGTG